MRAIFLTVVGLLVGAVFSQAPAFLPQYINNLDGEIAGLQTAVREGGADNLPEASAKAARLEDHKQALEEAGPFLRIVELARGFDIDVAARSTNLFEPQLPLTAEGAVSTAVGFVAGRGAAFLFLSGLAALFLRRRARAA